MEAYFPTSETTIDKNIGVYEDRTSAGMNLYSKKCMTSHCLSYFWCGGGYIDLVGGARLVSLLGCLLAQLQHMLAALLLVSPQGFHGGMGRETNRSNPFITTCWFTSPAGIPQC